MKRQKAFFFAKRGRASFPGGAARGKGSLSVCRAKLSSGAGLPCPLCPVFLRKRRTGLFFVFSRRVRGGPSACRSSRAEEVRSAAQGNARRRILLLWRTRKARRHAGRSRVGRASFGWVSGVLRRGTGLGASFSARGRPGIRSRVSLCGPCPAMPPEAGKKKPRRSGVSRRGVCFPSGQARTRRGAHLCARTEGAGADRRATGVFSCGRRRAGRVPRGTWPRCAGLSSRRVRR